MWRSSNAKEGQTKMTRFAPLTVAAGLLAATVLLPTAGLAADAGQDVNAWITQHQANLTVALNEKLSDRSVENATPGPTEAVIEPTVIRVSTVPVKRLTADAAI